MLIMEQNHFKSLRAILKFKVQDDNINTNFI